MSGLRFHIVDVFSERRYAGNQLAVVLEAGDLPAELMQNIAREMHFSETTFIRSEKQRDGGFDVRIFTPAEEVPFAGHPTLGTAFIIKNVMLGQKIDEVVLNLAIGKVPVKFESVDDGAEILWMKQVEPEFGDIKKEEILSKVLGLDVLDIDTRFPVQEVSTGLPHIIVPLSGLEALRRIRISGGDYNNLIENSRAKAILAFSPEAYNDRHDIAVRMFADYYGVPEDPATGSGNGCLAAYLVEYRYLGTDHIDIKTAQGHEINRPSLLHLRAHSKDGVIEVHVGGNVIETARGSLVR